EKATCLMDPAFLPRCFFEALVEAENSLFLKDFFGTKLYTQYMNLKLEEWESYRTFVTPREHKNNLHI
ncbi:MAG: glutamine synthetase, partial [SAR324 cluster bacterium]|nr:glutamine synthetase [SAR324 cluster bacterium]